MLIELPKGDIIIDKKSYLKDFKINIAANHQMRCKFIAITSKKDIPFDIVVYNWKFKLNIKTIFIDVTGIEMNSNKNINITVTYNIFSKDLRLNGTIDKTNINMQVDSFKRITQLISDIFLK